jgi:dTDP-4-dehydrorhamnose reductase
MATLLTRHIASMTEMLEPHKVLAISAINPNVIINATAYTAVDKA